MHKKSSHSNVLCRFVWFHWTMCVVGMTSSSRSESCGGGAMMKRIGGQTVASFHRGMSGLSARIVIHIQLACGSVMALTGTGDVTSSVTIRTQILWYIRNFLVLLKCHTVPYIR
jgi:hypothetical protein